MTAVTGEIPGYVASPWQQRFHNLAHWEALGAGSAGPGKTRCLIYDPFAQIFMEHRRCETPKSYDYHLDWGGSCGWALHLRRTLKTVEQTIQYCLRTFPRIDPDVHWDSAKTTFTFSSGFRYQFGHCKERNSYEDYMSSAYTHLGFDELTAFEQEQYEQIRTRCRTDDPVLRKMLKIRAMSNPVMRVEAGDQFSVSNPHWVRDYFVAPCREGNTTLTRYITLDDGTVEKRTRIYLPARLSDNPNAQFRRDYEISLQGERTHIRQALLRGDWYVVPGGFFSDDWSPQLHTCKPFAVPPDWPIFRAMDWGYKQPGCILWFAMDPDENLFAIRELIFQGKKDLEVAKMVEQIERDLKLWQGRRSLITGPADWQLWEERGDSGKTKAQVMAENGVGWIQCEKTKQTNAARTLDRLKDHDNGTTTPGLVFFNTCRKSIETIPMMQTDPNNPELPLDGGFDHATDCVFYACAYASRGKGGIGRTRRTNVDRDEDRDEDREPKRTGSYYGAYR